MSNPGNTRPTYRTIKATFTIKVKDLRVGDVCMDFGTPVRIVEIRELTGSLTCMVTRERTTSLENTWQLSPEREWQILERDGMPILHWALEQEAKGEAPLLDSRGL
jgi:hypothetical protein